MLVPMVTVDERNFDEGKCGFLVKLNMKYYTPYYTLFLVGAVKPSDSDLYLFYSKYIKNKCWRLINSVNFINTNPILNELPLTTKLIMMIQKFFLNTLNKNSMEFLKKFLPITACSSSRIECLSDFINFLMVNLKNSVKLSEKNLTMYFHKKYLELRSIIETRVLPLNYSWPIPTVLSAGLNEYFVYSVSGLLLYNGKRSSAVNGVNIVSLNEFNKIQGVIIENNEKMYDVDDNFLHTSGFVVKPDKSLGLLFSVTDDEFMVSPVISNSISFIGYNHKFYYVDVKNTDILSIGVNESNTVLRVKGVKKPVILNFNGDVKFMELLLGKMFNSKVR